MKHPSPNSTYVTWLADALRPANIDPPPATGTCLVLGYATGYDAAAIAPFVKSLRAVFAGSVTLVVDDRPDVTALLTEYDVRVVHTTARSPWQPHPAVGRFADFIALIDGDHDASHVLLADVRDIVFQADPFAPVPSGLEVFVENERGYLGDHAFNMKHMAALVGETVASGMADKPCICVGTVIGPRREVARLCRMILMLAAIPRSRIGGAFGTDQAACNVAVHLDLLPTLIQPNFGRVATVGLSDGNHLRFDQGRVVNPDGGTSAIVHQYDRHPHLSQAIHTAWGTDPGRCARSRPKSLADRGRRLRGSLLRRVPEMR